MTVLADTDTPRRWRSLASPTVALVLVMAALFLSPGYFRSENMAGLATPLLIALSTFVSEDLTCLAVGQMIAEGRIHTLVGIGACAIGIIVGDVGLWAMGALVRKGILRVPRLVRWVKRIGKSPASASLQHHLFKAILLSRFVPGTRLPLYVACGFLGHSPVGFLLASTVASLLWTPMIVLAIPLGFGKSLGSLGLFGSAIAVVVAWVLLRRLLTLRGIDTSKAIATVSRLWRWEFWPAWLFYLPMLPFIATLASRHRGLRTMTAANPGIPLGGLVGESKSQILDALDSSLTLPYFRIDSGETGGRVRRLREWMEQSGESFPLIFKPDVGERGTNVRLVSTEEEAVRYFDTIRRSVLVQRYHAGPFEAGIFYIRHPGHVGTIYSITDKTFPFIVGDGRSSIEALIWNDPRLRMQAQTFIDRHAARKEEILAKGQRFQLGIIGNHCRGTLFQDAAHLITPTLEARIDQIARAFNQGKGFFFGRFDVRYSNVNRFRSGEDLAIIELNGISSESTALYDPRNTLLHAYRHLYGQWKHLFAIGLANRRRGVPVASWGELLRAFQAYLFNHDDTPNASD